MGSAVASLADFDVALELTTKAATADDDVLNALESLIIIYSYKI